MGGAVLLLLGTAPLVFSALPATGLLSPRKEGLSRIQEPAPLSCETRSAQGCFEVRKLFREGGCPSTQRSMRGQKVLSGAEQPSPFVRAFDLACEIVRDGAERFLDET